MAVDTMRKTSSLTVTRARWATRTLAGGALVALVAGASLTGCAVSETDVKRWEGTERGPHKLVAVMSHQKYRPELRVEAALTLVRMRPRGGKKVGYTMLLDKYKDEENIQREGALKQLSEDQRRLIVNGMAPILIKEMAAPPPPRTPEGRLPEDFSIPYKDAAFAMLSNEPTSLVSDEATRKQLTEALIKWVQTGFEDRLENSSQQFSVEQMMRYLGPSSVRVLPSLITEKANRLDRIAGLVNELGEPETKLKASEALVELAKTLTSPNWTATQTQVVQEFNKKNNVSATPAQLQQQVEKMLDRRLTEEVFVAMKKVGGRPAIDFLLDFANDGKQKEDRRKLALAALEGRMDKTNAKDLERVFAVAKGDDTPDAVRDQGFRRLGEFPKEQIVPLLNTLFGAKVEPKKWKVRWVAASMVLKTLNAKQVGAEFMAKMPTSEKSKMGMTEPLDYGQTILKLDGDGKAVIKEYLGSKVLGPKLVALGSFYEGKKADVPTIQAFENDTAKLPQCEPSDECDWKCDVPKAGNPKETEPKELKTVGELVKFCIIPSMEK
ncbi:MAG TPA: hypothetical protein PLR99_04775 [Polyangiaceae bacterium]|jgi:hypothetical protein|nr:hypothetical protein [Polyangiaceae bacterium]